MRSVSLIDSLLYWLVRFLGAVLRALPIPLAVGGVGRGLGTLAFHATPLRRRAVAYGNIKLALGGELAPDQIRRAVRRLCQNLGMSFVELLLIPKYTRELSERLLPIENLERVDEALAKGRGLIYLTAHYGNWELLNMRSGFIGRPIQAVARDQEKFPRLNALLNSYRQATGCQVIPKERATRETIRALRENKIVGILGDQSGGARGMRLPFFGRLASSPTGAVTMAIKTGAVVLPVFIVRERGAAHRIHVLEPLSLPHQERGTISEEAVRTGLAQYNRVLEAWVREHPDHWLWFHKRWKRSPERRVIVLSDGRAGHWSQSEAVAKMMAQAHPDLSVEARRVEVRFRNKLAKTAALCFGALSGPRCQGCLKCLRALLTPESYDEVRRAQGEAVVSCGFAASAVNRILRWENRARSIHLSRPGPYASRRFDLVIAPSHDRLPKGRNLLALDTPPNGIDPAILEEHARAFCRERRWDFEPGVGLLIGGDTKGAQFSEEALEGVLDAVRKFAGRRESWVYATTSRRTSEEMALKVKERLGSDPRCRLLVIANEENLPNAVPLILGLSRAIIVSGESVSMVAEAASAGPPVLAFDPIRNGRGRFLKHRRVLRKLSAKGFIRFVEPADLEGALAESWAGETTPKTLNDNERVLERLSKLDL